MMDKYRKRYLRSTSEEDIVLTILAGSGSWPEDMTLKEAAETVMDELARAKKLKWNDMNIEPTNKDGWYILWFPQSKSLTSARWLSAYLDGYSWAVTDDLCACKLMGIGLDEPFVWAEIEVPDA